MPDLSLTPLVASGAELGTISVDTLAVEGDLTVGDDLTITDDLTVGDDIILAAGTVLTWDSDSNLYRVQANTLKTDDGLWAVLDLIARVSTAQQTTIGNVGPSNTSGIQFGIDGDTVLYRAAANVLKTDDSLAVAGGYGTSLPASPVDGQFYTLVDSVTSPTYQWTFRYNAGSSSSYKWEFIGGSPLTATVDTLETTASSSLVNLTTDGPSVTVPRAGDYLVTIGAGLRNDTAGSYAVVAFVLNGVDQTSPQLAHISGVASAFTSCATSRVNNFSTAGHVAKLQYRRGTSGTAGFNERFLSLLPRRVI